MYRTDRDAWNTAESECTVLIRSAHALVDTCSLLACVTISRMYNIRVFEPKSTIFSPSETHDIQAINTYLALLMNTQKQDP